MKYFLAAILVWFLLPVVTPTQAVAACTTIPCQKPVKKQAVVKEKYRCKVFDKASQTLEPCPVKKKEGAVKEKHRCRVFDKSSQTLEPCPVKKKESAVKEKYRCKVFDKDSQGPLPCDQ